MVKKTVEKISSGWIKCLIAVLFAIVAIAVGTGITANAEDENYVDLYKNGEYVAKYSNINEAFDAMTDSDAEYTVELADDQVLSGYKEWPQAKKITLKGKADDVMLLQLDSNEANFNGDVLIDDSIYLWPSANASGKSYNLNIKNHTLIFGEKYCACVYIRGNIEGSEGSKLEANTTTQIRAVVNVDIIEQYSGSMEILELSDEKMHISEWHTHGNEVTANGNIEVDYMDAELKDNYYTNLTFMKSNVLVHEIKATGIDVSMNSIPFVSLINPLFEYKEQVRYTGDFDGEINISYYNHDQENYRNYICDKDVSTLFYAPNVNPEKVSFEYCAGYLDRCYRYTSSCEKKDGMYVPVRMPSEIFIDDRYFNVTSDGHYEKEVKFSDADDIIDYATSINVYIQTEYMGYYEKLDESDTSIKASYKDGKLGIDINNCTYKKLFIFLTAKYDNADVEIKIPVNIVTPIESVSMDKSYVEFNDGYFNDLSYIINLTYDKGEYADGEENVLFYCTDNTGIIDYETEKTDNGYRIKISAVQYGEDTLKVVVNDKTCECKFKVGLYTAAYVEGNYWGTKQNLTLDDSVFTLEEQSQWILQNEPEISVFNDALLARDYITMESADPSIVKVEKKTASTSKITALKPGSTYITIKGKGYEKIVPVVVTAKETPVEPVEPKNGLYLESDGKYYYYVDGVVDTNFTDFIDYENGRWYVKNGMVDTSMSSEIAQDGNDWVYVETGKVNYDYTGMAENSNGWFYFKNGVLDWSYTGMAGNDYGWFYFKNGVLDWSYTGMAGNDYGWFYFKNGMLDWSYTGMAGNDYGWFYFKNGMLDWSYTGMAGNDYGWFYFKNGVLDWSYTGMAGNDYGWFYFKNGVLDWSYTGLAENDYGWFYFKNGMLDWNYTGKADNEYGTWDVVNGKVVN